MKFDKLLLAGLLTSFSLLTACGPQGFQTYNAPSTGDGIIGGTEVQSGDPLSSSIVAVYDPIEGQLCTGSLLPNNIVLTAAHCLGEDPESMLIFFDTQITASSKFLIVDKVEVSPYWASNQFNQKDTGDIALLHFKGPVPAGYKSAKLLTNFSKKLLKKGTPVTLAGFGISNGVDKDGAGVLRTTQVVIEDSAYSSSEITVNQTQGKGACHGDSGGPAYIEIKGTYYLWGITSRGVNDTQDDCSQMAAYTSVQYYKPWITKTANKLGSSIINQTLRK